MLLSAFLIFLVYSSFSNSILLNRLGLLTIIFSLFIYINSINLLNITPGLTLYNDWFYISSYQIPLTIIIFLLTIIILIYSTSIHRYNLSNNYLILIILVNLIGLLLLPMSNDLLTFYIVIELQSYSLYIMTGLHNRSYNASRASMLYFLMGGVASTIILLAIYFIYDALGTTNISDITMLYNYNNVSDYFNILLIALMFKMGMAPLHNWSISVYNYAPTYITLYISIVAKISIISWIFNHTYLFNNNLLIIIFYISLIIAAYKPLYQVNIKTILAYSGLLNFGYILLTVICFDISFYIYLLQYTLTHIILFLTILAANTYIDKPVSKWSPILFIHQLIIPNKTLITILIITLFSLIGIPPLPGFYGKLYVIIGALEDNYIFEVIFIIIFSVISTYYYANIIKITMQSYKLKNDTINKINPSLAYTISTSFIILISFYWFIPNILEGLYLIIV